MPLLVDAFSKIKKACPKARIVYKKKDETEKVYVFRVEALGLIPSDFFLVARSYIFETDGVAIVSSQYAIIEIANKLAIPIKMYIKELDRFFDFDPKRILKDGYMNKRDGITFWNWRVKLDSQKTLEVFQ